MNSKMLFFSSGLRLPKSQIKKIICLFFAQVDRHIKAHIQRNLKFYGTQMLNLHYDKTFIKHGLVCLSKDKILS